MPHQHRRAGDTDDGKHHVVQAVVESVGAKAVARVVIPAALSVITYFVVADRNDSRERWQKQEDKLAVMSEKVDATRTDMRVMTTRLDEGFVRDVRQNKEDIADLKRRVQVIERVVKTP